METDADVLNRVANSIEELADAYTALKNVYVKLDIFKFAEYANKAALALRQAKDLLEVAAISQTFIYQRDGKK